MMKRLLAMAAARPALLIFLLALLLRVIWVATLKGDYYWSDERAFAKIAHGMLEGKGYISQSYRANPGVPFYLSLMFRVCGENLFLARLGQCLFGALTCVLIWRIGVLLIERRVGLLAGLVVAIYPPLLYLSGVFYAEGLMIFFGAVGLWLAAESLAGQPRLWQAALSGVALGLAVLTRSTLAFWVPCVALAFLCQSRHSWSKRIALGFFLGIGAAATILPWTFRNYVVFGRVIPVNTGFGTTLWQANNPFSTGAHTDWYLMPENGLWDKRAAALPPEEQVKLHQQYDAIAQQIVEFRARTNDQYLLSDHLLMPLAIRYLVRHPGQTMQRSLVRLRLMFSAFAPTETSNEHTTGFYKRVAAWSYYPMLILAVVGMVVGLAGAKRLAVLYLAIGIIVLTTMVLVGTQTRYRLPIDPYLILFAAVGVVWLSDRVRGSSAVGAKP